jgi:dTDP-4-amino-4,6-dideoxygalactose transaminase
MPAAEIRSLERRLADFAGRRDAVLLGNANTGLYLSLRYLAEIRGPGEVIVSPIVCPSVIQTIIYAGFAPVFADVDIPLCTISAGSASEAIGPKTRAILAIHIFGHSADTPALAALADEHDIWLIEDAAQSIGGTIANRRHGSWGNCSFFSFGRSKIISAGRGGALLSDDDAMLSYIRGSATNLVPLIFDAQYELLSLSHRNLIHSLMDALRVQRDVPVWRSFANLMGTFRPLYQYSFPQDSASIQAINDGLDALDADLHGRQQRAAAYWSGLADLAPTLQMTDPRNGSGVVWRFTTVVAEDAMTIRATRALRKAGLHVSNHYWSVAELLHGRRDLPNADFVSSRLINFWVEPSITQEDIERSVDVVRHELF